MLTGRQIRIARSLLGWAAAELADQSKLDFAIVEQAERYPLKLAIKKADQLSIQHALETAGVDLSVMDGNGAGARMMPCDGGKTTGLPAGVECSPTRDVEKSPGPRRRRRARARSGTA